MSNVADQLEIALQALQDICKTVAYGSDSNECRRRAQVAMVAIAELDESDEPMEGFDAGIPNQ